LGGDTEKSRMIEDPGKIEEHDPLKGKIWDGKLRGGTPKFVRNTDKSEGYGAIQEDADGSGGNTRILEDLRWEIQWR
jgi:hypothetical protein